MMRINRLFAVLSLLFVTSVVGFAQTGTWHGKISVQGIEIPLVFHFEAGGCTIDSPSQGVKGIPAVKSMKEDGTLRVDIKTINASYEGKMEENIIKGTFTQNGFQLPLTLEAGQVVNNRPQTPKAPFPYTEENVSFKSDGYTLHGTLSLPKDCNENTPVVLMVTGSGQQNRDEELFEHKPFAVIADALARNGIASLRYDDRGWKDASVNFLDFTTEDFKHDAEAGVNFLRKRFEKVGVLGHSEGGTIALLLAAEGKPDFIVSLAGMAISAKETLLDQNRQGMASIGLTDDMVNAYCAALDKAFDELAEGKPVNDIKADNVPALLKPYFGKALQQGDNRYFRNLFKVNPSQSLSKIKCPVLALNGTKDTQVDCEKNLGTLKNGLKNSPHTVKQFDGLNHLFQHCTTGSIVEYQQIEETISPEVLSTIVDWVKSGLKF